MKSYFALFVIAVTASGVLTPMVRRFCERYGVVDDPRDDRRVHVTPIPRLGGVAIFLSVLVALSALLVGERPPLQVGLGAGLVALGAILVSVPS